MESRRQLQTLGISLIVALFLTTACSPATAPAPTPVPTKPAAPAAATPVVTALAATPAPAATLVPTKPAATPTRATTPTVARTVAPTRPAATATVAKSPTPIPRTPTVAVSSPTKPVSQATSTPATTRPAAPTTSTSQQAPPGVIDCGPDLGCFIEASRAGRLARVDYTMSVNFFGMFVSNTDSLAIQGEEGDRLLFSQKTIQAVATMADAMMKSAQEQGMSGAEIQKALTTAEGVANLVQLAAKNLPPDAEEKLRASRESQQARVGIGKQCKFPQAALTAMLERWQKGQYSSSDYDPAECIDIRPTATPAPTLQAGAIPAVSPKGLKLVGASALPEELKAVPLPPGFGVEEPNVYRWAPDGVFRSADASLFGKTKTDDVAEFYTSQLEPEWIFNKVSAAPGHLDFEYGNSKDPSLILYIVIQEDNEGTTVNIHLEKH